MKAPSGRITVDLVPDEDDEGFGIEVSVSASLSTLESVGLLHLALKQHLESTHRSEVAIYQAPDADAR